MHAAAACFDEKPDHPKSNLISMGIYVFNKQALIDQLEQDARRDTTHDFGGDIVPAMVAQPDLKAYGFPFDGYWRDVGTIESYYDGNMDLLEDLPDLSADMEHWVRVADETDAE